MDIIGTTLRLPLPHRVILDEGPGYVEMLEISEAAGIVTAQLITDEDGQPSQITTFCWPKNKHAAVMGVMGDV